MKCFQRHFLTQCAEDDGPAAVLLACPDGGNGHLVLGVRLEAAQRYSVRVARDHRHHPVTNNLSFIGARTLASGIARGKCARVGGWSSHYCTLWICVAEFVQ